jgi:hypothetical protein
MEGHQQQPAEQYQVDNGNRNEGFLEASVSFLTGVV